MQLAKRLNRTDTEPAAATSIAPADEPILIDAARDDPAAFGPLYERYAPPIFRYCQRRLGSYEDAADATAQVFERALGSLRRFQIDPSRPGSTVRAWLFTIARNVVIDTHRSTRWHRSLDLEERPLHLTDGRASPEESAIAADDAQSVAHLLHQLPERQRAVVELRLAGLAMAEIAIALDISESAAKSLQVRAYRTLRNLISPASHPQPESR